MTGFHFHESLYRSPEVMARLRDHPVTICGAGALGANLAESLARIGMQKLKLIDRDRVEERNLSTQPYFKADVGAHKAKIMANSLYRALGVSLEALPQELNAGNVAKLLRGSRLVVDCFDNSPSRALLKDYCQKESLECLHAGMADGYAEVIWNAEYRVPSPAQDDICDYPLARNLVTMTVAIAAEVVVRFVASGARESYTFTLGDLRVSPY